MCKKIVLNNHIYVNFIVSYIKLRVQINLSKSNIK